MATSGGHVAALAPRGIRDVHGRAVRRGETVGSRIVRAEPTLSSAMRPLPRFMRLIDKPSRRRSTSACRPAAPRPAHEDQGRGYPQIAGAGCGMAAAVASAADQRRGHRARPDRRGADLRRCLRLDLGRCRPPPHHTRTARQGARGPLADALARLGHRGPARCRRRRPLAAGAAVRARCRARPRPAAGPAAGQAQAWQR